MSSPRSTDSTSSMDIDFPFRRDTPVKVVSTKQDLIFNVLDYHTTDERTDEDDWKSQREYTIRMFGVSQEGHSVCLKVTGFKPHFYIKVPDVYAKDKESIKWFKQKMCQYVVQDHEKGFGVNEMVKKSLVSVSVVKRKDLFRFHEQDFLFLQFTFHNYGSFMKVRKVFLNTQTMLPYVTKIGDEEHEIEVYEANLDPLLRFIHIQNFQACGWVRVKKRNYFPVGEKDTTSQIEMTTSFKNVEPIEISQESPYITAVFDIECDSSHGDFPQAKKTYYTPSRQIVDAFWERRQVLQTNDVQRNKLIEQAIYQIFGILEDGKTPLDNIDQIQHKSFVRINAALIRKAVTKVKRKINDVLRVKSNTRAYMEENVTNIMEKEFGKKYPIRGDAIIQIGTTIKVGKQKVIRHIVALDTCDPIPGVIVESHKTETDLLMAWQNFMLRVDPDIVDGYNIHTFDEKYIHHRVQECNIETRFMQLGRMKSIPSKGEAKTLSSAAMGDNELYTITMIGRVKMDLIRVIRTNYNLESYKLDSVAQTFVQDGCTMIPGDESSSSSSPTCLTLETSKYSATQIKAGDYVCLKNKSEELYKDGTKFKITEICDSCDENDSVCRLICEGYDEELADFSPAKWCLAKDDVSPKDIFQFQKEGSDKRALIAKYCVMDCDLVADLENKLQVIGNSVAMANVCSVPLTYIFMRGQGIKIESLVFKECRNEGQLIPVLMTPAAENNRDSYEGAIVLPPKKGIYLKDPVSVLDYSSLYPSSMISENISHDSLLSITDYDFEDNVMNKYITPDTEDLDRTVYDVVEIKYDLQKYVYGESAHPKKVTIGTRVCTYAQFPNNDKGTVPKILMKLLKARKDTRKTQKTHPKSSFMWDLLECQQLAFKITANSLYGQLGSKTSKVRKVALAASTTAFGRKLLNYAKVGIETLYGQGNDSRCDAEYVYGDTDSVFIKFAPKDEDGNRLEGKEALKKSIELAQEAEEVLSACLKPPHTLEYEKTFYPFILFSKKRYVGNLYETDPNKFKRKSMGIVTKRRDNAPIVKDIYNGVLHEILGKKDINQAVTFTKSFLQDILAGKFPMSKMTITKSLRARYANRASIAHVALADRMGQRDPGNKPQPNDRIPYVFVETKKKAPKGKKLLQGERVEHPSYIRENNMKIDYEYYITNQIQKPLSQLFALGLEDLKGFRKHRELKSYEASMYKAYPDDEAKAEEKINKWREKEVEALIFRDSLNQAMHKKQGYHDISTFFTFKKKTDS